MATAAQANVLTVCDGTATNIYANIYAPIYAPIYGL